MSSFLKITDCILDVNTRRHRSILWWIKGTQVKWTNVITILVINFTAYVILFAGSLCFFNSIIPIRWIFFFVAIFECLLTKCCIWYQNINSYCNSLYFRYQNYIIFHPWISYPNCNILPEHVSSLQLLFSLDSPLHGCPDPIGLGFVHVLILDIIPFPQDLLHCVHKSHPDQEPSTYYVKNL